MVFFIAYAILIWVAVSRYRRRWQAFVILAAGIAVVLFGHRIFLQMIAIPGGQIPDWILLAIWPYAGLIGLVGFIFSVAGPLPGRDACRRCGYDMTGISLGRCPECGMPAPGTFRTPVPGGAAAHDPPSMASPGPAAQSRA